MNGTDLLADFRECQSEQAFSELVRRYTNLVYSVARRRLSNVSLAQEVTQIVFIRLAKAAPKLRGDAELAAWLHRTTVHASIDLWRSEIRRRVREEQAVVMQSHPNDNAAWNELAPVLDEALNELNDADRQVILLRFFDEKSMRDLGICFGVSEDAAKMRVSRALDRLRAQLGVSGVSCSAIVLGTMLTERSVEAAPSQFAAALAALRFPVPAGLGAAGGIFGFVAQISRVKVASVAAAILFVGAAAFMLLRSQDRPDQVPTVDAPQTSAANSESGQNRSASASDNQPNAGEEEREPDPLKLLQVVALARQRIASGSMVFQVASYHLQRGKRETNDLRIAVVFDGQKLRFESFNREYSYVLMGDNAAEISDAEIEAQGLDTEGAARAGLLKGFESHHVLAYDGAILVDYWENDAKPVGTTIRDPREGSSSFIFDPRCLGLRTSLGTHSTIENCLGYIEAKVIKLVGKESVDGFPAWHVQVKSKHDESLDFWIDVARPDRLLKHSNGRDEVISKYDNTTFRNPIPTEVTTMHSRNGSPSWGHRFVQSNAQFNIPVDPASFTLAGLRMPAGTSVSDNRNHRGIGYWTGSGLSESLPSKKESEPQTPPNLAELLAVLENYPASPEALDAATWILLNTPDGMEVEKAAEVILREHTRDTNLVHLCKELERMRHRCSKPVLEALLKDNPSADVRGTACFALATMLKVEAKHGQNRKATAEAVKLFERVMTDFSRVNQRGYNLDELAKPQLYELRHLIIGKPAPETEGEDLDGQKLNLGDYRGNVVVLFFWTASVASDVAELRKLAERMTGKPLALIGVNCDRELARAKASVEKYEITWPSLWDKRDGPISVKWNVHGWLTTFVLDAKGVIRYRDVRGRELNEAVDALLHE